MGVTSILVDRRRVLERIRRFGAPVTVLLAPAGYGKTYLAQRIAKQDERWASVVCGDPAASPAQIAAILERWKDEPGGGTLVLEHADACVSSAHAHTLGRLLGNLPPGVRVLLCARSDAVLTLTASLAPHAHLVLRRDDLAFDQREMRALFAAPKFDDAAFLRICGLVRGWPAAALYLERVWSELEPEALARPEASPVLAQLLDYLYANVLEPCGPELLRALARAVALGDAGDEDLAAAYPGAAAAQPAQRLVDSLALATRSGNRIEVHPLVAATLLRNRPQEVQSELLAAAQGAQEAGDFARAARCFLQAGLIERAQDALARAERPQLVIPSSVLPRIQERVREMPIVSHPALWASLALARRLITPPQVLAAEARAVLAQIEPCSDDALYDTVLAIVAAVLGDLGEVEQALELCARVREPGDPPTLVAHAMATSARAALLVALGRTAEAQELWATCRRLAARDPQWLALALSIEARVARARGQWELEADALERMTASAERVPSPSVLGRVYAEGTFGAWLAGDDAQYDLYRARLRALMLESPVPALVAFDLAAQGEGLGEKPVGAPLWEARACVMACASADARAAGRYAARALEAADRSGERFIQVLARVACAEKLPGSRGKMLAQARDLAGRIESAELHESLATLQGDVAGMLVPFVDRLRARSSIADHANPSPVELRIADGTVVRGEERIHVSVGGMALLVALAFETRLVSSEVLCDRLYPDADYEQAYKALKMCVHRTRAQLHDASVIETTEGGYRLAEHVAVDTRFLPRILDALARSTASAAVERRLDDIFAQLAAGRPASYARWEWFAPSEAFLQRATHEIGVHLGKRALREGDHLKALEIAGRLIAIDPLDEAAQELLVRAHLEAHDRSSALLEYRRYQQRLASELGVEPSETLRRLIEGKEPRTP